MYTADEMLNYGVHIEKNGRDFYDLASKTVKAERVRQVFAYIANDEQLHIAVFEGILNRLDSHQQSVGNYSSQYTEYLSALVEANVFIKSKQGSEIARTIRNDKQALELALGFEKDSLLFCLELKKLLWPGFHKEIDTLIAEEQDHFQKLCEVMKGFTKFGVGYNKM
ncbi:MAG: ferritin family protein [Elusimicrobia bacterium]|nr:ferritin family protein [Elusimicrobiota bacterium]